MIIVSSSAFTVLMMSGVEMRPPFTGLRERSMRIFFCIASPTWISSFEALAFAALLSVRGLDPKPIVEDTTLLRGMAKGGRARVLAVFVTDGQQTL